MIGKSNDVQNKKLKQAVDLIQRISIITTDRSWDSEKTRVKIFQSQRISPSLPILFHSMGTLPCHAHVSSIVYINLTLVLTGVK